MGAALKLKQPEGELISVSEIARRCKINRTTAVARLEDLGYESDPSSTAKNHLYFYDDEMEFAIKAAKDSLSAAKIHSLRIKTRLDEIKLAEAQGALVPMQEVIEIAQRLVNTIYQELTVRQIKRVGPKLAKAKNVMQVKTALKHDNSRIMKSLRENFEKFLT